MKTKKFLKLVKSICSEKNCAVGRCPLAEWGNEEHTYSNCIMMDNADEWNIDEIIAAVKRAQRMRKAGLL